MSKLDQIRAVLEKFGATYYGNASPKVSETWDYTVFRRAELSKASNDFVRKYTVAIVRESYIPENLEFEIIKAIIDETNLRLSETSAVYNYVYKGSTDLVVEICVLTFFEPLKRCKVLG